MSEALDALFEENIETFAKSLDKVMQRTAAKYKELQKSNQKGKLSHIYISFLQSSVLCKLPWLRIDLYDDNDRSDITECFADWDVSIISDKLYRDADNLAKEKDRIKDYELEQLWVHASAKYMFLTYFSLI